MALKPTNPKKIPITEVEFRQKLKNKDGDFQNRIFDFAITRDLLQKAVGLAKDGNIHFNFDLDFGYSEFQTIDVGSDMPYNYDAPKVRFSGKVNFEGARFSGEVNFWQAIFSREANFHEARFSGIADFARATFSEEIDFSRATFSEKVDFSRVTFLGKAYFKAATFSGKAHFYKATFLEEVDCHAAIFSRKAEFNKATLSGKANFSSARFSDIADFGYVVFLQKVDFTNTIFLNEVRFRRATFSQNHHTYFCNLNLKQNDNADERNEKETYPAPRLQFRDTIFPKLVLFSNYNLYQTTFEKCTIADIKFRSCEFAKTGFFIFKRNTFENRTRQKSFWENICFAPKLKGRLLKKDFSKKREEIKKEVKELEKNNEKLHSRELETEEKRKDREDLCCQMKTALESSKRWRQAGDFYIGELEARRSKNWWEYLKLTCFKYLLGYAERISILFISITILFFAAALILGDSLYGFSFDGWFVNYNWSCFEFDFEKAAKSTLFPLTLRLELKAGDAIKFWETVFLIASWVLWITLAVAVRRRFRF